MTVYFNRARDRWCYDFQHQGQRFAGYATERDGTPAQSARAAAAAEARARAAAEIAPKLPRAGDYTLAQAFADLTPAWQRQDDWPNKQRYMRELIGFFGAATAMVDIDTAWIARYVEFAHAETLKIWCGGPKRDPADRENARFWRASQRKRSPSTINLYLKTLALAIGHAARQRDPVTGALAIPHPPAVPVLKTTKRKARPVPDDALAAAMAIVPAHVKDAIMLTLYFGFRKGEVFGLTIDQIDQGARGIWLAAADVKNDADAFLPGAPAAMAFAGDLVDQARARGATHLITWRRTIKNAERQAKEKWRPIANPKRAWSTAMTAIAKRFGRKWRWHDIRASFITQVAITSGAVAAQKLARHASFQTTQGYIDVADDVGRRAAAGAADRPALRLTTAIRTRSL